MKKLAATACGMTAVALASRRISTRMYVESAMSIRRRSRHGLPMRKALQHVCETCGDPFAGGPNARKCPACRLARCRAYNRAYKRRGARRPLGSTDNCSACGGEYEVRNGGQKWCPVCGPAESAAIHRARARITSREGRRRRKEEADQIRRSTGQTDEQPGPAEPGRNEGKR